MRGSRSLRTGIRARLILGVLALVALSLWLLGAMLLRQSASLLALERQRRGRAVATAIEQAAGQLLGGPSWPGAGAGHDALLALLEALAADPSVEGIDLAAGAGRTVASTGLGAAPPPRGGAAFAYGIEPRGLPPATVTVRFDARGIGQQVAYAHLQVLVQLGITALVLVIFLNLLLAVSVVRPIRSLVAATGRIARGDLDHPVAPGRADELGELAAALDAMRLALRDGRDELVAAQAALAASERMAAVGRVAAGVAHEVGNPLGAVTGYLAMLRRDDLAPGEARDYLERTEREVARVNRIMLDLLDWARPPRLEPGPVDLNALLRDLARHLRDQPDCRPVTLRLGLDDALPTVTADYHRTRQLLLNLALNAAQAMPGGGEITLRTAAAPDGSAAVEVRDTGPGIPPEVAAHLFEPFVSSRRGRGGTGLGLAICRRTAEAMGASIGVETAAGRGTAFTVRFPPPGPRRRGREAGGVE